MTGSAADGRGAAVCRDTDRGAGTVLVIGLVAALATVAALLGLLARAQGARWGAQTAADLAALAAASLVARPAGVVVLDPATSAGEACDLAADVAARNGATVTHCTLVEGVVVQVTTARGTAVGPAVASARAGPAWARAGLARAGPEVSRGRGP